MVRVIPVHNFTQQNVSPIEEPTTACVVNSTNNREFLLLALTSHCVEAHELNAPSSKLYSTFPTVDLVENMVYCAKGNYIATLETKFSRDNMRINNFVRVYVNWETHDQGHAMRARIAGRVTPSLNRPLNSLEMIELPLNAQPTAVSCCQKTGNLLVAMGSTAVLHEFKVETQQPSKQKFIDFEARPWALGFQFSPTRISIVEDFVSVMDPTHFIVFRLMNLFYEDVDYFASTSCTNSSSNDKTTISTDFLKSDNTSNDQKMSNANYALEPKLVYQQDFVSHPDYRHSARDSLDRNSNLHSVLKPATAKPQCINWDQLVNNERKELRRLIKSELLDQDSLPITVGLPSISLERAGSGHAVSPFVLNSPDTQVLIKTTSPEDGWSENFIIKNILRLKITMARELVHIDSGSFEFFTCSELKPLYLKDNTSCSVSKKSILRSDEYKFLNGVTCLICTTQEGYVYHFPTDVDNYEPVCLNSYPFTAPVSHVTLDHTVLHALTESGLESYTLRLPKYVARTLDNVAYPDVSEPVCLIGLRPFLGIQLLLSSESYVVLLAKSEDSWTLYSLKVPNVEEVYFDILNAAKSHKRTSPSTYQHLLEEACSMLWLMKNVIGHGNGNAMKLEHLFHQSCVLLGDFYIRSESRVHWRLCVQFYKMSGLKPAQVLSRKAAQNAPGLLAYLSDVLLNIKSGSDADALFQSQNIIDVIAAEKEEDLVRLILGSAVLREYSTEKLIKLLIARERDDSNRLVLVLLHIQADKQSHAERILEPIPQSFLSRVILAHPHLLFEETLVNSKQPALLSFSEFSGILMRRKRQLFADVLSTLIQNETTSLTQIIQSFMDYLPSRVGRDGHVDASALQLFLETYLRFYFKAAMAGKDESEVKEQISRDYAIVAALKILVRSYLGKLVQISVHDKVEEKPCEDKYLFAGSRPVYLDKMPPCSKDYLKILKATSSGEAPKMGVGGEDQVRCEVLKLQALLASQVLPAECIKEIEYFLDNEEVSGGLALKTLCIEDTQKVTLMLTEECPQALFPYVKWKYTKEFEWKAFLEILEQKIMDDENDALLEFYKDIFYETLKHVAETLPLKTLHSVLPKDEDDDDVFQHFMEICTQTIHAEHVKSLIKEMSHQLLSENARARIQASQNLDSSQKNEDTFSNVNHYVR